MPLELKKITEFRKISEKQKEKALKEIAKLDTKKSLPVIIKILEDVKKILEADENKNAEAKETQFFLDYCLNVIKEADEKQNVGIFGIPKLLSEITKEQIKTELGKLVEYSKQVHISKETQKLWEETALWLEGVYQRAFDKLSKEKSGEIKRNKDGSIPPTDAEDKVFFGLKGMTKFDIYNYYHETSLILSKRLAEFDTMLNKNEKKELTPVDMSVKEFEEYVQISVNVPKSNPAKIQQFIDGIKNIHEGRGRQEEAEEEIVLDELESKENLPSSILEDFFREKDEVRFPILISALEKFNLTNEQTEALKNFKSIILSSLSSYVKSSYSTYYLPTYLWPRAHVGQVCKAMDEINETDDSREHLKTLFSLWNEVRGENSVDVSKKVIDLFNSAFTILLKSGPSHRHVGVRAM